MRKSAAEIAGAMITAKPKKAALSKYPEFPIPDNFQPPNEVKPDTDFQALGTFRMKGDGNMCLVAVDGSPVVAETEEQTESY